MELTFTVTFYEIAPDNLGRLASFKGRRYLASLRRPVAPHLAKGPYSEAALAYLEDCGLIPGDQPWELFDQLIAMTGGGWDLVAPTEPLMEALETVLEEPLQAFWDADDADPDPAAGSEMARFLGSLQAALVAIPGDQVLLLHSS